MSENNVNRRSFLKTSTTAALATSTLAGLATAPAKAAGSNEKIRIGFIGPGGRGFGAHVKTLAQLKNDGANIELVAAADVYSMHRDRFSKFVKEANGNETTTYINYTDMLEKEKLDAVCIGTPDHWHAKQTIDSMNAGKHVYCEKPMTKKVEEALDVVATWKKTGKIMQVGVQSTSLDVWNQVRTLLQEGKLGKVLQFQTEYFRNSNMGQWRYYKLFKEMTPKTIDWEMFLGTKEGLADEMPFDREVFAQWRRFWPFGAGMYTDLFVHRTTCMLKATGLRFPGRVVGAGGIFLEYDGRDVPDVATVAADFNEGVQGMISSTMCSQNSRIKQVIRGHNGSFVFGNGENFESFDFVAERPQVTLNSKIKDEKIKCQPINNDTPQKRLKKSTTYAHFKNWVEAMQAGDQSKCNNPPDLGAAAIALVNMGARSYREGKVYHFDVETGKLSDGDSSWSKKWEKMSKSRSPAVHIPGWKAGETGSKLVDPEYMKLAGPWKNGQPPAAN